MLEETRMANMKVGEHCEFPYNYEAYGDIVIGDNCKIETGVIIGYGYGKLTKLREGYASKPITWIGNNVHIRTNSVIYAGCIIKDNAHIAHNVVLREYTEIGEHSSIGSGVVCEGYTKIGHHTTIHAQTHLTARMNIGNYVFIGPMVTTMNDRKVRYYRSKVDSPDKGPTIRDGVVVGAGAKILPDIQVSIGAFIAVGSVVTRTVPPFCLVMGVPAKQVRRLTKSEIVDSLVDEYEKLFGEIE